SGVSVLATLIICSYGYGAHQRNIVWGNSELLWKDVTVKSPKNGRGLMNYGLTKMEKGEYDEALKYYKDAEKLLPTWSYLHINLAILYNATGNPELAEQYFEKGLLYGSTNAEVYYFYAKWLTRQGRKEDAIKLLRDGQALSPGHIKINAMLARMQEEDGPRQEADLNSMEELVTSDPSPSNYLNLSLAYYRSLEFEKCIEACVSALELDPQMAAAYNNICGAYNQLKQWELAAEACRKAIELQSDFALARNNLSWAESEMEKASTN
ncbi:MAG: tetratricopeptide repeat protein, partial [Flavobacteriales bacterium]|nr:tetratricopeptide repeat protein [Flavobacteriales bacterium]